jgi:hypothetical protein
MAYSPFVPRSDVETALAAFDRLIKATTPDPDNPWDQLLLKQSKARWGAETAKRGLVEGLAQRDAADRADPRRAELPERLDAALLAVTDCIDGMRALERAKCNIQTAALADGFVAYPDGRVGIAPQHHDAVSDQMQTRRAHDEHRMMSVLADMTNLQQRTVAVIRERLGADQPGIPWVLVECARAGIDLESFDAGARLPGSPLRDLMQQLATDMKLAKDQLAEDQVWADPLKPDVE